MKKILITLLFFSNAVLAQDKQDLQFVDSGDSLYIKTYVADIGQCISNCASQQGRCIARCQGDGQCISDCASDHGQCVANCQ